MPRKWPAETGKYYAVDADAADNDAGINFYPRPGTSAPNDYVALLIDLERTQTVIKALFFAKQGRLFRNKRKRGNFDAYFGKLVDIAQTALGQDQVPLGRLALTAFQDEVVTREATYVKNSYIRHLGAWALGFGVPTLLFYLYCRYGSDPNSELHRLREFVSMIAASFLGTWLSFSIRRVELTFWDLARLERDLLDPGIRLIFVAGLTVVVGLLLAKKAVVVTIGGFNSADFLNSGTTAVLIGCLCGIGELGLSAAVARRASEFTSLLGATKGEESSGVAPAATPAATTPPPATPPGAPAASSAPPAPAAAAAAAPATPGSATSATSAPATPAPATSAPATSAPAASAPDAPAAPASLAAAVVAAVADALAPHAPAADAGAADAPATDASGADAAASATPSHHAEQEHEARTPEKRDDSQS
jgi:hypothetical protein